MEINKTRSNSHNLVVYHNNLSDLALKNFNAKERDLLMALCSRLKDCGTDDFRMSFREIRKLANYKKTSNKALSKDLDSMTDKLFSLGMKEHGENGEIRKFIFFQGFDILTDKGVLDVSVGKRFSYLINELGANFTSFELEEHTSLKSNYSKECYRQLMRYKDKGCWWVYAEKFVELLDLPKDYRQEDIKSKVIPTIERELSSLFEFFESSVEYKGGKPYKYTFRFSRFGEHEEPLKTDTPPKQETSVDTDAEDAENTQSVILDQITELWNNNARETAIPLVRGVKKNTPRWKALNARIKEYGSDGVFEVIKMVFESRFLTGNNNNNWVATFDWVMNPNNFLKVLEGNYADKKEMIAKKNTDERMRKEEELMEKLKARDKEREERNNAHSED